MYNLDQAELFGKVIVCNYLNLGKKPKNFKEDKFYKFE